MKRDTGFTDCNGIKIKEGDQVECFHPIYESPKRFVVSWDMGLNKFNLPSSKDLLDSCKVVDLSHKTAEGIKNKQP